MAPWAVPLLLAAVYLLAYLSWTFLHWGGEAGRLLLNNLMLLPVRAVTVFLAWQISSHPSYDKKSRQAWNNSYQMPVNVRTFFNISLMLGDIRHSNRPRLLT